MADGPTIAVGVGVSDPFPTAEKDLLSSGSNASPTMAGSASAEESVLPASWTDAYRWDSLWRKKPLKTSIEQETATRHMSWIDLTAYGIAGTIGSGIYVTCGRVARDHAGPGVVASILLAGILSALTGICYLEFASALPISGSGMRKHLMSPGYAYLYTLVGEFPAWFIGWNLTLEYAFAAAAISAGWVEYLVTLVSEVRGPMPRWLHDVPLFLVFRINILAGIVALLFSLPVLRGVAFGSRFTNAITSLNIFLIFFIIVVGSTQVSRANWLPFFPRGLGGVVSGGGEMFFSFIGFETVSTFAPDAVNPSRDVPIAALLTVALATALYMGVGLVLTGMQPSGALDGQNPLAMAFVGVGKQWAYFIVTACALTTMTAAIIASVLGQPKIIQAIAKDGLLPQRLGKENRRGVPRTAVYLTLVLTVALALTMDMTTGLIDMISFGCLFGMSIICASVMAVRFVGHPTLHFYGPAVVCAYVIGCVATSALVRVGWAAALIVGCCTIGIPFAALVAFFAMDYRKGLLASSSLHFVCPLMPLLPCLSIFADIYVMMQLNPLCIPQYIGWTVLGLAVYFLYGIRHSQLREYELAEKEEAGEEAPVSEK